MAAKFCKNSIPRKGQRKESNSFDSVVKKIIKHGVKRVKAEEKPLRAPQHETKVKNAFISC
jgi:hypothetical protein